MPVCYEIKSIALTAALSSLLAACGESKTPLSPNSPPVTPMPFGFIAFVSTRDGSPYIYVDSAGDPHIRRLARGENPAWSWDGLQIVFNDVASGDDEPAIRIINADGSGEHALPIKGTSPAWSPDGAKLAFATPLGIYLSNADGSAPTRLVPNDFVEAGDVLSDPSWAPDGKQIAFTRTIGDEGAPHVYIVGTDGSAPRPLLDGLGVPERSPRWSRAGDQLTFQMDMLGSALIVTENVDGSGIKTLFSGAPPIKNADWSSEGFNVSFATATVGGSRLRIFVTDTRTRATRQLIPDVSRAGSANYDDYQGAWSHGKGPWDY
jgi:Tol biopolymer transport system component